ncbi:FecR family protein [Dyadobacter frigoris]|uniref:DUF4974 domain-containing protein n=1 Tax=Dyadobacter frigoris TaxID=2576211 RepID=A0A4U6CPZ5_9BACT|nr:FecR domain-containing protein [Dyadobacter frigoris]TKT86550.1 DUF4974 domain-containing protein [Dyadobacter frigoris]
MEKDRLLYLLEQEKKGRCSAEEAEELESWYNSGDQRSDFTSILSENALNAMETRVFAKIQDEIEQEKKVEISFGRRFYLGYTRIAASVLVLLIAGLGIYYFLNPSTQTERTAYGETRKVFLPDGSEVTLNGNSQITYQTDWQKKGIREVNLSGEAYFKVIHTKDHRKFRVRTNPDFSLDVLGTQFNVASRKSGTRVVLNEGRVRCNLSDAGGDTLILKPGEMMQFTEKPVQFVRKKVEISTYSAWKDHKLIFKNSSLKEISVMLEETYGLKMKTGNPELLERQISGSVPTANMEVLLLGIAEASSVTIQKDGDQLIIADRIK